MIRLLAVASQDSYAVVEERGKLYFIRPPFTWRQKELAGYEALDRAVQFHGFTRADATFAGWDELIGHLRQQALEAHRAAGHPLPDLQQVRRLVERAPEPIVQQYLGRIEAEILPNRKFSAGRGILTALLRNPVVEGDRALLNRCARLLEACNQDAPESVARLEKIQDRELIFPSAVQAYGTLPFDWAAVVRDAGQVMPVGPA